MGQRFLRHVPRVIGVGSIMAMVASCALSQPPSPAAGRAQALDRGTQGGSQPQTPALTQSPSQATTMVTITMQNLRFTPGTVTVAMGTPVTWINNDPQGAPHTTTSDSGLWDSGRMNVGARYSHTFDQPGTYRYHCTFHQDEGMVGTIIVQ